MKVLITDHTFTTDVIARQLADAGHELITIQDEDQDAIIAHASDANALIVQYASINRHVIDHLTNCRVIIRYGIGVDNVDLDAAAEAQIYVANVPDYGLQEVADSTMSFILNLTRQTVFLDRSVREGHWDFQPFRPIQRTNKLVLGLVGFGNIARLVARRALAFDLKVMAFDPYVEDEDMLEMDVQPINDLDELLAQSNILSLHVPYTEKTRHMINQRSIEQMKPGSFLVNTARGGLIDASALADALDTGTLAGAALDVFEVEPIPENHPLYNHPKVIITPHAAYVSEQAFIDLRDRAVEQVLAVLDKNQPPQFWLNRDNFARSVGD